ncbi:MAG: hypothetical protein ACYCV7_09030 [Acidimicrobiales bacterium]
MGTPAFDNKLAAVWRISVGHRIGKSRFLDESAEGGAPGVQAGAGQANASPFAQDLRISTKTSFSDERNIGKIEIPRHSLESLSNTSRSVSNKASIRSRKAGSAGQPA